MTVLEAKNKLRAYLKKNFVSFEEDLEKFVIVYKDYDKCPDKALESCIYFNQNFMECLVYYTQTGANYCKNSCCTEDFFRLLNYINAQVFPSCMDGMGGELYQKSRLYLTRIYMTEDGARDICIQADVPYLFYETAPLETEDFLTACLPELMNALSPPIFMLLLDKISIFEAIKIIKRDILMKESSL